MTHNQYGGKCHICGDLNGPTHNVTALTWLSVKCQNCSFCQERRLAELLRNIPEYSWSPNVRDAIHAIRENKSHPLIDQLRAELEAEAEAEA